MEFPASCQEPIKVVKRKVFLLFFGEVGVVVKRKVFLLLLFSFSFSFFCHIAGREDSDQVHP